MMTMTADGSVREPEQREWLDDIEFDLVVVRRYDEDDIMVGSQYFVLMQDESMDSGYILSSIAEPPEPVS